MNEYHDVRQQLLPLQPILPSPLSRLLLRRCLAIAAPADAAAIAAAAGREYFVRSAAMPAERQRTAWRGAARRGAARHGMV